MTPSEILSKIKQFATTNKKMILMVVGGIAATGIIAGAIMYTSGTVLQGSVGTLSESPTFVLPVTEETVETVALATRTSSCTPAETQTQSCTLATTGAAGTQSRTCSSDATWGAWSACALATPVTCSSYTYTEWGTECLRGYNFRSILTSSPTGCEGGDPVLRRACITENTCVEGTASQIQSCTLATPATSGIGGTQTRTCGQDPTIGTWVWSSWSSCAVAAPSGCTSYSYSNWSTCVDGSQSRTVTSSSPTGCEGGIRPILNQSCSSGTPAGAAAGTTACTSHTYSNWSTCANGSQSRTVTGSSPSGCTGGATPVLTQSCSSGTSTGTGTGSSTGTGTGSGTGSSAGAGSSAGTQIQEEAPTACTGEDILTCSAMSDVLYLSDKIPLRLNCALTANGIVSSQVIKGAISDPNQAQSDSSIMKKLQENKSYTASKTKPTGFNYLYDGYNRYDSPVDEGDYSILTTARLNANSAPDCSVQKFKVVKERPQVESTQESGDTQESATSGAAPAASGASASGATPAPPVETETPPEPSKCPGINYPKDVKGHWAENLIMQAYDFCMFKGYDDGTFRPDRPITRAEALKTILSAAGIPPILGCYDADCGSPFRDLEMWQGQWARAAWDMQIVKGAEKFRPGDAVTRAEAAIMVANAFIKSGKITTPLLANCFTPNCGAGYPDNFFTDITESWQGPAIRWLWDAGLTQGRSPGRFEPGIPITRAELTKLVMTAAAK